MKRCSGRHAGRRSARSAMGPAATPGVLEAGGGNGYPVTTRSGKSDFERFHVDFFRLWRCRAVHSHRRSNSSRPVAIRHLSDGVGVRLRLPTFSLGESDFHPWLSCGALSVFGYQPVRTRYPFFVIRTNCCSHARCGAHRDRRIARRASAAHGNWDAGPPSSRKREGARLFGGMIAIAHA
jgi:hypothetical protein